MKNHLNKIMGEYGIVVLVGTFFALTSIYNSFGESRDVFWNTYIKTVRELFVVGLIALNLKNLSNVLSILYAFAAIVLSLYMTLFRIVAAFLSGGDYELYYNKYMQSNNQSLIFIVVMTILIFLPKYLNKK